MGIITKLLIIIILSLILLFSLIHLAVSIAILAKNGSYGDLFRPEKGLAAANIVISFFGLVVGGLGLFCVITGRKFLSIIVAVISFVLGLFALASLIAALVINSNSFNYVNTYLSNNMNQYMNNLDSRNVIDRVQTDYKCCGRNMWLDWTLVQLGNTTVAPTMGTTLMPGTSITSTLGTATTLATATTTALVLATTVNVPATTVVVPATTVKVPATTAVVPATTVKVPATTVKIPATTAVVPATTVKVPATTVKVPATTAVVPATTVKVPATTAVVPATTVKVPATTVKVPATTAVVPATTVKVPATTVKVPATTAVVPATTAKVPATTAVVPTTTPAGRMIHGNVRRDTNHRSLLQNSFKLAVRQKRQTTGSSSSMISVAYSSQVSVPLTCCVNSAQSTCMSSSTNPASQFYTTGCLQPMVTRANQQDMGIGVINCFMMVLALVAIPLLLQGNSKFDSEQDNAPVKQINHTVPVDSKYSMSPQIITTYH